MIITRKTLPRRTFLRGAGAALALPLLDAMTPALSGFGALRAAEPVRRLGWVYLPNGMAMESWTPAGKAALELSPTLSPLGAYRDRMVVLSGLAQGQAEALGDGNGEHTRATATWLNGVHPKETEGADVRAGMTADQIAAAQLGRTTPLPSLELAIDRDFLVGNCENGYSCIYMNTIAWRDPTTPLPMENNPRVVFERMFGDSGSTDPAVRRARMARDRSILDSVTGKVADLKREVGPADSLKVDEYLEGVRDIERRIERAEQRQDFDLPDLAQPEGIPATFAEHVELMFDLQVLAHQTDLTRVTSFMLGREVSSRTYTEIGIADAHHPLSHHEYNPEKIASMSKINAYHASMFADYLAKLRSTPDGDGSLLDNMLLLYGCGMSDSNAHSPLNLPVLLLGGCAGQLEGGRHIRYEGDPLMPNLLVTLMDKLGVPVERLGKSDGRLSVERLTGV